MSKLRDENEIQEQIQQVRSKREKWIEMKRKRKRERSLVIDFSKQHLSVSKALQKHEFLSWKEAQAKKNSTFVAFVNSHEMQQKELIRKFLEQRNLLRMNQAVNDKRLIETKLKEQTEVRVDELKNRVDNLKVFKEDGLSDNEKPTNLTKNFVHYNFHQPKNSNRNRNQC